MSLKITPAPKCVQCKESVYPQELVQYDNMVWHQNCFKCTECRSFVPLTKVAMIKGTLYCKNCFMKIFKREGRYSSFDKTNDPELKSSLISSFNSALGLSTGDSPASTPLIGSSSSLPPLPPSASASPQPPPAPVAPVIPANKPIGNLVAGDATARLFFDAVDAGNEKKVRELLTEHGVGSLFSTNNQGVTPLQLAFSSKNSTACGQAMMEALKTRITVLEKPAA